MADGEALRQRRSRLHRRGDHSLCRSGRCDAMGSVAPLRSVPVPPAGLVESYRRGLEAAGRLGTPEADLVLAAAEQLAHPQGQTLSAFATLSKELRAAYDAAVKGAPRAVDGVDELQARRRARILGA